MNEQAFKEIETDFLSYRIKNGGDCKHISFDGIKGGSGKTTLSINTAILLAHFYRKKVLVVDLDRNQATAAQTLLGRNKKLVRMAEEGRDMSRYGNSITVIKPDVPTKDYFLKIIQFAKQFDYCIYDGGGYSSDVTHVIGLYSHIMFCPIKPDAYNYRSLPSLKNAIKTINYNRRKFGHPNLKSLWVLNHISSHPNSRKNREAYEILDSQSEGLFPKLVDCFGIAGYEAYEQLPLQYLGVTELFNSEEKPVRQLNRWAKTLMKLAEDVHNEFKIEEGA